MQNAEDPGRTIESFLLLNTGRLLLAH